MEATNIDLWTSGKESDLYVYINGWESNSKFCFDSVQLERIFKKCFISACLFAVHNNYIHFGELVMHIS